MIGDRERVFGFCSAMSSELERDTLGYWRGAQQNLTGTCNEGLRNIYNDPDEIERRSKALAEYARKYRESVRRGAIYSITQQPFYGEVKGLEL